VRSERLLAIACLLLVAPVVVQAQTAPECARYRLHDLTPGMSARDVRDRMDERGEVQADKKSARYHREDSTLWVEFDDPIGKKSARLTVIRSHTGSHVDPSTILSSLVEQLGEPTTGREHLDDGLREGSAVWTSAECGIEIEARRQEADWWDPSKGGVFVEARAIPKVAGEAAVVEEIVEEAPVALAAASTAPDMTGEGSGEPAAQEVTPATRTAPDGETPEPEARDTRTEAPPTHPGASLPEDTIAVAGLGGVTHPERLEEHYVKPAYPMAARRAKVNGTVHLDVIVQNDGAVGEITVVNSTRPGSGFEEAAIAAVRRWRYRPALRDGKPVDVSILVRIDFK